MSPVTHFFLGWCVANLDGLDRRERGMVTVAGIAADVDGLGIVAEYLTRGSDRPLLWWSEYHHVLAHNLLFGLFLVGFSFLLATRKWLTALLVFFSFHLHLLCDLVGARGPEGEQWPIPYLYPFVDSVGMSWSGQWALNAWPNFLITALALGLTFYLAWRRGFSPLGLVSESADRAFVNTLRARFGRPDSEPAE